MRSFCDIFDDVPDVHIVDVGASPIDGNPVYQPILDRGGFRYTGFEPNPEMFEKLKQKTDPRFIFYPYAIGDGSEGVLNICAAPGMNSLFEPDHELLGFFHGFAEWAQIIERKPLTTHRLDDIEPVQDIDFIKIDVQGGELAVLQSGLRKLEKTLVVEVETLFLPYYKNQPLFGDVDLLLRKAGFMFHRFGPMVSRVFKPLLVNNDIYAGFSQVHWSDAVYVRPFVHFDQLPPAQLLKLARLVHDLYGSFDLSNLALREVDRLTGSKRESQYMQNLMEKK